MAALDYCTLNEAKEWLRGTIPAGDASLDAVLARTITASSRLIDQVCGLPAGSFTAQTLTKTFDVRTLDNPAYGGGPWYPAPYDVVRNTDYWPYPYAGYRVPIPPLLSLTTLTSDEDGDGTYEVTWASTDYRLDPTSGPPYRALLVNAVTGVHTFPLGYGRVRVVGSWGVSATVPDPIRQLCMELAARKWKRADSPFGVLGSVDTGLVTVGSDEQYAEQALKLAGYMGSQSWVLV